LLSHLPLTYYYLGAGFEAGVLTYVIKQGVSYSVARFVKLRSLLFILEYLAASSASEAASLFVSKLAATIDSEFLKAFAQNTDFWLA
jgi:hypothetical protein